MGTKTGISWAHHTFNVVWGCTVVSPGCDHCYARKLAVRYGHKVWGADAPRRSFGDNHWFAPIRWNLDAAGAGERRRVFCSSMADVFDAHPDVVRQLPRLWELIRNTPCLDWLLLTKRHGRIARSLPADWGTGYPNVWLGVSAENQEWADRRTAALLEIPATIRWISAEPLLGPIRFPVPCSGSRFWGGIHWLVAGGESGPGYRPMDHQWARELKAQCDAADVAWFFKQTSGPRSGMLGGVPEDLLGQEFPA